MKKKGLILLFCIVMLSFGLYGCGGSGGSDSGDNVTFIVGTVEPEDSITGESMAILEKYVEEESGGTIDVQVNHNSTLGGERELIEGISAGTLHFAMGGASLFATYDEKFSLVELPFLFQDSEQAIKALNGGDMGKLYDEWFDEIGFKCFGWGISAGRGMGNTKHPIHTPEDLKGLKMRVQESDFYVKEFKLLGANPITMSYDEVFTALQQGTIDGHDNPPIYAVEGGFHEVCKYYTRTNHCIDCGPYITSKSFWEGLTDEQRTILEEGINQAIANFNDANIGADEGFVQEMKDAGCEVIDINDEEREAFAEKLMPMYDDFRAVAGDDAVDLALSYSK